MFWLTRSIIVLFAFGCLAGLASGQEQLRWKFEKGQSLKIAVQQTTKIETTAGATPRTMSIDMLLEMTWSIDEVDEQQVAEITQTFTRLKATLSLGGKDPIEYDSASSSQPLDAAQYFSAGGKLVGAKITMKMNDRGEILDAAPAEETEKLLKDAVNLPLLTSLFSKEGIRDTLKQTALTLPEQPLAAGDKWTTESSAKLSIGPVDQKTTYTYQGLEDRDGKQLDAIDVAAQLTIGEAASSAKNPVALKEQEHSGTLYFDRQVGRFVETQINQRLVTQTPYRGTQVRVVSTTTLTTTIRAAE